MRQLGKLGVQFVTFPETVVPYYPYFSFVQPASQMGKEHQRLLEESVTVPSVETNAIAEAAKEGHIVVSIGVNERDGGSPAGPDRGGQSWCAHRPSAATRTSAARAPPGPVVLLCRERVSIPIDLQYRPPGGASRPGPPHGARFGPAAG
ncbi:MAG: hypothetical protein JO110_22260 [Acetobacteraceae bacterium]|nr:hypothetical protein [Acetobacteraceae bacterium]